MEFKDLPPDTQKIAAETLKSLILDGGTEKVEPAKKNWLKKSEKPLLLFISLLHSGLFFFFQYIANCNN
ncbi:hypothetical protein HMPREF0986_01571 [Escherichia coli 4_1_47FAA]|nr:hypothetical protein HMPREF0986_01571 [Escherichia coli 4_1_47FAA]